MKKVSIPILLFSVLMSFDSFAALNLDLSYWRITDAKASFNEKLNDSGQRESLSSLGGVETTRNAFEIKTDQSKYLFDLSYNFEDVLYRLTMGIEYAGNGNSKVKDVSWADQVLDIPRLVTNNDFDSGVSTYTNAYLSYRLLPFSPASASSNSVKDRGIDCLVTWTKWDQKFSVLRYFDRNGNELPSDDNQSGIQHLPVEFTTTADSIGLGLGGETRILGDALSVKGRVIYLPFFESNGNGWDSEIKVSFALNDFISVYAGGKWFKLSLDANQTISNMAKIEGFSSSAVTFKGLDVDAGGYTLGVKFTF